MVAQIQEEQPEAQLLVVLFKICRKDTSAAPLVATKASVSVSPQRGRRVDCRLSCGEGWVAGKGNAWEQVLWNAFSVNTQPFVSDFKKISSLLRHSLGQRISSKTSEHTILSKYAATQSSVNIWPNMLLLL